MKRVLLTLAGMIAFAIGGFGSSQAADWPANVRAVYDINFNGFTSAPSNSSRNPRTKATP